MNDRRAQIVGVAEAPLGEVQGHSELSMLALATREALDEGGMSLGDVDGIFVNYMGDEGSAQVAEYLGVQPRYADTTDLGGAAFVAFLQHASLAILAGRCEVALIAYASRQRSRRRRGLMLSDDRESLRSQFELPHLLPTPIGQYALAASRHFHEFGTTPAQLAEVAIAARQWAELNPKAWIRDPLTMDDVLASRMICEPLRKLDCCLVTDGGGAVVLTTPERARDSQAQTITILGVGESHTHYNISQMPSLVRTAGEVSAREAFGMAGVKPEDVDMLQPYDSFTITVLLALEDLGFCEKGESGAFVEQGTLAPGGALPAMTSGGGLSYNHPGALGVLLIIEAVRQLRGEAGARQVAGAEIGVVHGVGGDLACAATAVLARD